MTKFSIEYNPYLVQCVFKKNGKVLNDRNKVGAKSNERLQVLLGKMGNWKGLPEEIDRVCDDNVIEIAFRGRKIDYDDLEYAMKQYKGSTKFKLKFEEATNDADIISELDRIFAEIKKKNLPEFHVKNKNGKDIFEAYEDVKNGIFEVSVIATMSSGKSTLINSLLHTELLPAANRATTATIAKIYDNDEMNTFEAECYAEDKKTIIYPRKAITKEDMERYNLDEKVTYINIEGNIPGTTSDKIRLCLRDTPGPNNSRDENHERLTQSVIRQTNAIVLYVMNATQIGINDDEQLLRDISEEMKTAGKQSRDRFIFVVNKCDAIDEQKEGTLDEVLETVRDYLKGFDIIEPTLIPTSAQLALLLRKDRAGQKLTRAESRFLGQKEDFVKYEDLYFEKYATLTPSVRAYLEKEIAKYHANEEDLDLEALIHTGVPAVEQTISEYIDKYAYPMKIKDAISDILTILEELDMVGEFEAKIVGDKNQLENVREQIKKARRKHDASKGIYTNFKMKIAKLDIEECDEDAEQFNVDSKLMEMTKEFIGKTNVDKIIADQMIVKFLNNLDLFQANLEKDLNRKIDSNIFKKCTEMLEEYTKITKEIIEGIDIKGYDFSKVSSFRRIRIQNVNEIRKQNEHDRYRKEIGWKDNPERAGFWGKFKFWEPKQIPYEKYVKDGVDVNVYLFVVDVMSKFTEQVKNNVSTVFKEAYQQVGEYKKCFEENVDALQVETDKILNDLEKRIEKKDELALKVKNNEELFKWICKVENQIKELLIM